jgi:predicted O-linked N-acetylglucosamine transferase (SPINDLY family)
MLAFRAGHPQAAADLIAQARDTTSLFDTPAYCKALEQAYEAMLAA